MKTEQDTAQYLLDQVSRLTAENAMIKEKWSEAQPEQEPVAWMYEWEEIGGKEWTSVKNGKYPPIVEEEYCMRNLRPLYLVPPKREPLTPQQISEGNQSMFNCHESFIQGVIFAEKAHGIGGGK